MDVDAAATVAGGTLALAGDPETMWAGTTAPSAGAGACCERVRVRLGAEYWLTTSQAAPATRLLT
jgi:hypothetical protein